MKYTVFVMDPYGHYDENPDHLKPGRVVKSITIPERPKATTCWTAAGLWAQGDRGIVTGTVKDASGAVGSRCAGDGNPPCHQHEAPGVPVGDVQPAEPDHLWSLERSHHSSEQQLRQVAGAVELRTPHAGIGEVVLVVLTGP